MSKLEYLIDLIRNLKEDGTSTMSVGTGESSLGYNVRTETPPVRKKRIYLGKGSRKPWMSNPKSM